MRKPYTGYLDRVFAEVDARSAGQAAPTSPFTGSDAALGSHLDAAIGVVSADAVALSQDVHAHPELGFEEHHASSAVAALLAGHGIDAELGAFGLPTALRAVVGDPDGPRVVLVAEYDALPEIGHACGHNVIAGAAVGAFLALARLGDGLPGTVELIGSPAEEGGGGKQLILEAGGFVGADAALMVHPFSYDLAAHPLLGFREVALRFRGLAAHASGMPFLGRNALDAVVAAYTGIAALRQHMLPGDRVHGVITDGGQKPNIVPDHAAAAFYVRSARMETLAELADRVGEIAEAAALSTGTDLTVDWHPLSYLPLLHNGTLVDHFANRMSRHGRVLCPPGVFPSELTGSTDMGNVSQAVPTIHPFLKIAPPHVAAHSPEFTAYAASQAADDAVVHGADALARTCLDVLSDATLRTAVRDEFEERRSR